jgi:MoxR-like ATPase
VAAGQDGAPGRIRTSDHLVRSQVLYPAELRARRCECGASAFDDLLGAAGHRQDDAGAADLAGAFRWRFLKLSAVLAGVKDIRAAVAEAQRPRGAGRQQGSVLFIDEVHRFNKSQQDALLPHVEDGTVVFIGATTENPSFELNNALLSRARVYVLKALEPEDLEGVIDRALADAERGSAGGGWDRADARPCWRRGRTATPGAC